MNKETVRVLIVLDEDNKALDYVLGALSVGQKDISILIEDINDFNYHPHFDKNDVLKVTAFLKTIKEFK